MSAETMSGDELRKLPILTPREILGHCAEQKDKGVTPTPVLIEVPRLIELLEAIGGFVLNMRRFLSFSRPEINLIEPPIMKDGKACCVYPYQFERMATILTLRQVYSLPLATIRELLEHYPKDQYPLIIERKFKIEELLDLAKMLKNGFEIKDLVMSKGCDLLLQDLLPPSKAVSLAVKPGDSLREAQEQLILARLDEMKAWVSSGRWQQYIRRESAQDFRDLANNQLIHKKVVRRLMAQRARVSDRK